MQESKSKKNRKAKERKIEKQKKTNEQTSEQTNERANKQTNEQTNKQTYERINGPVCERLPLDEDTALPASRMAVSKVPCTRGPSHATGIASDRMHTYVMRRHHSMQWQNRGLRVIE